MWTLDDIKGRFDDSDRLIDAQASRPQAAVAMILRTPNASKPTRSRPEVFVIERASHDGDPWSGHMALPGGRLEAHDEDLAATAIRETREETGLQLSRDCLIGRLHDIDGRHSRLIVSCFIFSESHSGEVIMNREVAASFWVPFDEITSPQNLIDYRPPGRRWNRDFPGIRVGDKPNQVIWGLTYRMLCDFLGRMENIDLPVHIPPPE